MTVSHGEFSVSFNFFFMIKASFLLSRFFLAQVNSLNESFLCKNHFKNLIKRKKNDVNYNCQHNILSQFLNYFFRVDFFLYSELFFENLDKIFNLKLKECPPNNFRCLRNTSSFLIQKLSYKLNNHIKGFIIERKKTNRPKKAIISKKILHTGKIFPFDHFDYQIFFKFNPDLEIRAIKILYQRKGLKKTLISNCFQKESSFSHEVIKYCLPNNNLISKNLDSKYHGFYRKNFLKHYSISTRFYLLYCWNILVDQKINKEVKMVLGTTKIVGSFQIGLYRKIDNCFQIRKKNYLRNYLNLKSRLNWETIFHSLEKNSLIGVSNPFYYIFYHGHLSKAAEIKIFIFHLVKKLNEEQNKKIFIVLKRLKRFLLHKKNKNVQILNLLKTLHCFENIFENKKKRNFIHYLQNCISIYSQINFKYFKQIGKNLKGIIRNLQVKTTNQFILGKEYKFIFFCLGCIRTKVFNELNLINFDKKSKLKKASSKIMLWIFSSFFYKEISNLIVIFENLNLKKIPLLNTFIMIYFSLFNRFQLTKDKMVSRVCYMNFDKIVSRMAEKERALFQSRQEFYKNIKKIDKQHIQIVSKLEVRFNINTKVNFRPPMTHENNRNFELNRTFFDKRLNEKISLKFQPQKTIGNSEIKNLSAQIIPIVFRNKFISITKMVTYCKIFYENIIRTKQSRFFFKFSPPKDIRKKGLYSNRSKTRKLISILICYFLVKR